MHCCNPHSLIRSVAIEIRKDCEIGVRTIVNRCFGYNASNVDQSWEKMSDRSIMIQLPEALLAEIDTQAELTASSRTKTIVKMLQQAVENQPIDLTPLHTILSRVAALEQKLEEVVDRLDGKVLAELKFRVSTLERERVVPLEASTPQTIAHAPETRSQATAGSKIQNLPIKNPSQGEWMTVKEAFAWLGGEPKDPSSGVTSLDGRRSVGFNRFRVLKAADYQAFGLEFQSDLRRKQQPCLRPWQ